MNKDFFVCSYCGKSFCKMGIGPHIWRTHTDGKNFDPNIGYKNGTRHALNKGLTKDTNQIVRRISTKNTRVNAKYEGIEFNLSFEDYMGLVKEAGLRSSQLGFTGEGYVLARFNDAGDYSKDNCRFITQKENSDEKNRRLFWDKHEN